MLETILLAAQPIELATARSRVSAVCQLLQSYQLESVHLVTGASHSQVKLAVSDQPLTLIYNPYWQDGLGHSIAAGIQDIHYDTQAVLVVDIVSDNFDIAVIKALIDDWLTSASTKDLKQGLPAIFGAALFPALAALADANQQQQFTWGQAS